MLGCALSVLASSRSCAASRPEFSKIHFVPFQDTLPAARGGPEDVLYEAHRLIDPCQFCRVVHLASRYEYDIFNDYLKPYLTRRDLLVALVTCYDARTGPPLGKRGTSSRASP